MNPLSSIQAAVVSLAAAAVGAVIAFVPSWGPAEQAIIGALTAFIVLGFLVANAIHAHGAKLTAALGLLEAATVSLLTAVAGVLVAFVPSFAPEQKAIVGALTAAVVLGFLVANAIHAHASAKT
jgi:hypothetical protein